MEEKISNFLFEIQMIVVIDMEEVMLVYDLISEYGEEDVNWNFCLCGYWNF